MTRKTAESRMVHKSRNIAVDPKAALDIPLNGTPTSEMAMGRWTIGTLVATAILLVAGVIYVLVDREDDVAYDPPPPPMPVPVPPDDTGSSSEPGDNNLTHGIESAKVGEEPELADLKPHEAIEPDELFAAPEDELAEVTPSPSRSPLIEAPVVTKVTESASNLEKVERPILLLRNDDQIRTEGSLSWSRPTSGFAFYIPRGSANYIELVITDSLPIKANSLILAPRLSSILSVARARREGHSVVALADGRTLEGKLRGNGWEGETEVQGFKATRKFTMPDVREVLLQTDSQNEVRAVIHEIDGSTHRITNPRFQVLPTSPGTSYSGNACIEIEIRPGTFVRFQPRELETIEFVKEAGAPVVDVKLKDGRSFSGTTNDGLEAEGQFTSGPFRGIHAWFYVDNKDLGQFKRIGPFPID